MNTLRTLCVMGTFDQESNREVSLLKDILQAQGITADVYEPHITFGIYTDLEDNSLREWVSVVASRHQRIPICFNHFGFFPDTQFCFLAPCPNYALLDLHSDIHKKYDTSCIDKGCLYSLKQNSWVPHTTIASVEPGQERLLLCTLRDHFSPFAAEITRLRITSSDMEDHIGVFELKA